MRLQYLNSSVNYNGLPITKEHAIDTELVSNIIIKLKHGKAKDINDLTAEHLYYSHPSLSVALAKLFQLILLCSHVPDGFRHSYIVPVPKPKELHSKSLECNDFRGIAISPIISKVFEHCLLDRFSCFLKSSDNQFGFKKGLDVTLPFVLYAASLTKLFKEAALRTFAHSICRKHSTKSTIMHYT